MKEISLNDKNSLLDVLKNRFNKNMDRHKQMTWDKIESLLTKENIYSLYLMEKSDGEPDVIALEGMLYYIDMSKETPKGRRSICYDKKARISRTKFPPKTSAIEMADEMNIKLLDETLYYKIQAIESIDTKTSSWILTPSPLRELGGALFADNRYERTFIYHNGADSYYGVRGFRGYFILS